MPSVVKRCPTCGRSYEDPAFAFCGKDGTRLVDDLPQAAQEAAATDANAGRVVGGRYEIVEEIGSGAMGKVYRARDVSSQAVIALKLLDPELANDPIVLERFRREADAVSRIRSHRIVTVHQAGVADDGTPFIAMEHVPGRTLRATLDADGPLEPAEAVRVAFEITTALIAAHEAGVVHRDLKPENVMLTGPGRKVKVLDFGIAKIAEPDAINVQQKLTRHGAVIGTPLYMSPEAVERRPVGPPGDLYALGVILFEMLVGLPPFRSQHPIQLMGMHLRVPPPRVTEASPELYIPRALDDLVERLLSKEPQNRPATARLLAQELEYLEDILAATDVLSRHQMQQWKPPPPEKPPKKTAKMSVWAVGLLAFVAAASLAAIGAGTYFLVTSALP